MKKKKKTNLTTLHDDPLQGGHTGIAKTLAKVKRHYFWKGMSKQIADYIKKMSKMPKSENNNAYKDPNDFN